MADKPEKTVGKTLCDFKRGGMLGERFELYREIVAEPAFFCRKCARVASVGQWLCKPLSLDDPAS